MRPLSLLLLLFFLVSILPSVDPSIFSRLHSSFHHDHSFHSLQLNNVTINNSTTNITSTIHNATHNNIIALQYILTLKHLNNVFYTTFQQQFNESWPQEQSHVYQRLEIIRENQVAHTALINQTLYNLSTIPVPPCNYNFSFIQNITNYIAVGALLQNTVVFASNGVINSFSDPIIQQLIATITTVDARQAAYLNHIIGNSPFPYTFDLALYPQDVISTILSLGIITSCPYNLSTIYPIPNPEGTALSLDTSNTTLPNSTSYTPYTSFQEQSDLISLQLLYQLSNLLVAYNNNTNVTNSSQWMSYFNHSNTNINVTNSSQWNSYGNHSQLYYTSLIDQNQVHSQAIANIIIARGGIPAEPCIYNFSINNNSSLSSFLTTFDSLQTIILHAYNGMINHIYDLELQTFVTTIATVNSRHIAFIRELIDIDPFQQSLDNVTIPEQAIQQILETGFIISCPQSLVPPPSRAAAPTSAPTSTPISNISICPSVNFTNDIVSYLIYFNTTTNKSISYVDVHVTVIATNLSLNFRMNPISSSIDTKVYTYLLPEFANGNVFYWFTYVTPDAQGIIRGCDSQIFTTNIDSRGNAGVNPSIPCPAIEFDHHIMNTTIYFNVTSNNITLSYVDVHFTHNNTIQWNYRMNASEHNNNTKTNMNNNTNNNNTNNNNTTYSFTLPSFMNFSVSHTINYWFTYGTESFQCDTDVYTGNVTLSQSTPSTSAPTTASTSAPTIATTSAPTTATTIAPTTAATSAPTTGDETTSVPTSIPQP